LKSAWPSSSLSFFSLFLSLFFSRALVFACIERWCNKQSRGNAPSSLTCRWERPKRMEMREECFVLAFGLFPCSLLRRANRTIGLLSCSAVRP
jgi:hypothetical protein